MPPQAASQHTPGPRLVLDQRGDLAFVNDSAIRSLGVARGDLGRPFQDLTICHAPVELHGAVVRACSDGTAVEFRDVASERDDRQVWYDVQVLPLAAGHQILGVEISFRDVTRHHDRAGRLDEAYGELEAAYRQLRGSQHELVTASGQLRSSIEEFATANEELRRANAELESMNDELRSANEQLQALAGGLRDRAGQNEQVVAFLESALLGRRRGLVVVDRDLVVRVWNERAESMWGPPRVEAQGRHVLDLDVGLPLEALREALRGVLAGECELVRAEGRARNRLGEPVSCVVSCTPLRLAGAVVCGAVLVGDVDPAGP
jgi:two-component system CheB/CheR fusion protein